MFGIFREINEINIKGYNYMKYICDNDLHIHSNLSLDCTNALEQTSERILKYAIDNNLKTICLTNHYWDENVPCDLEFYKKQDYGHLAKALPLPKANGVEFLFGCEADIDKDLNLGITKESYDKFDFIVVSTTHFTLTDFTLYGVDDTNEGRARLWVKRLETVLNSDLPFNKVGLAHLATRLLSKKKKEGHIETLNLIPQEDMERLFIKAAKLGCGIEINREDMSCDDDEMKSVLHMFKTAKKCGCKFYLGSDAHNTDSLDKAKAVFEKAVDLLSLNEEDKFHIRY